MGFADSRTKVCLSGGCEALCFFDEAVRIKLETLLEERLHRVIAVAGVTLYSSPYRYDGVLVVVDILMQIQRNANVM